MLGGLNGPWIILAALVLLSIASRRHLRWPRATLVWLGVLTLGAAGARLVFGIWGPLHVNGQAPLWVRGAIDAVALVGYGPGYFELLGWVTHLGIAPDTAVFAANALLSAVSPALLYAGARLAGVGRGGALAVTLVLAADVVSIRTAASEGYLSALIALVLAVQGALALAVYSEERGDRRSAVLALAGAGLLAAAAARIHPTVYVPLALCPLTVLGAAQMVGWRTRVLRTLTAAAAIGLVVVLTSGVTVVNALQTSQMTADAFSGFNGSLALPLAMLAILIVAGSRLINPPTLPWLGVASLLFMLATQDSFQEHPFQELSYQRLFFPGLLLGFAALLPRRLQGVAWALAAALPAVILLMRPALPHLDKPTTEQLEYRFLQTALRDMPRGCTLAAVSRAGKRIWEIPGYLIPGGGQRAIENPSDLESGSMPECLLYVRASACTSSEARPLCEAVERRLAPLERVAGQVFPAAPSYADLPFDRDQVEVVLFKVAGAAQAASVKGGGGVSDGAAITPAFAKSLFDQLAPLHEADGCKLARFDTSRFRITMGFEAPTGAVHTVELATASASQAGRKAGAWALAPAAGMADTCAASLAAVERVLASVAAPRGAAPTPARFPITTTTHTLLATSFVLLLLGTFHRLYREGRRHPPPLAEMLGLFLVWAGALALRIWVSPHTFLHEYYHIAETIAAELTGDLTAVYGNTGPVIFRLVASVLRRPQDVDVIFATNAVLSSLAIPAIALLDLALTGSWARALCAAVLLAVLPLHLRFSAAEDLFVLATTFGLWTLVLFAAYLRTRALADALLAALALSLAMQTRPEMLFFPAVAVAMVLFAETRSWRVLFAWRTWVALSMLAILLVPRFFELQTTLGAGSPPAWVMPSVDRYLERLVFLDPAVTPPIYWLLSIVGSLWCVWRRPGLGAWVGLVFVGYTVFALSIFDNAPYNLRSQLLPTSFVVLVAAGVAPLWLALWGRAGSVLGVCGLALVALSVVATSFGFVTELRDQQLEWAFLQRSVPQLPAKGVLLTAVEPGGRNLNVFPQVLLTNANKSYELIDVRQTASGNVPWPAPAEDLLFYQGMFCYFAFADEPPPEPMSAPCKALHERYVAEPVLVEDLVTPGYSVIRYTADAQRPFRIGFYRLAPR